MTDENHWQLTSARTGDIPQRLMADIARPALLQHLILENVALQLAITCLNTQVKKKNSKQLAKVTTIRANYSTIPTATQSTPPPIHVAKRKTPVSNSRYQSSLLHPLFKYRSSITYLIAIFTQFNTTWNGKQLNFVNWTKNTAFLYNIMLLPKVIH